MAKAVKPIPEGLHTVTPHLAISGAAAAIEFYRKAFGAQEMHRSLGPDGKSVIHAEIRIGDSAIFLADEMPGMGERSPKSLGNTTVVLNLFVEDADALWKRAVEAGAEIKLPIMDAFWGDRYGLVADPFGHVWALATHKEDLTPEELERRAREFFAKMAQQPQSQPA
ncbi:MAG: VOC family protein [bacterium]